MAASEPKPWYERLLEFLERWRLVTGLILLAFVIGGGFTLLIMEKLRKPETVVTETREVTEEKIVEETPVIEEAQQVAAIKSTTTQPKSTSTNQTATPPKSEQKPSAPAATVSGKININSASASELESLPSIGPKLAERIIEYRTANGSFKSIEEIINVKGIGDKTFEKFRDQITI
ncbi:helix-hairpin-helix domain-containing protein [Candidatus Berkelbacteria bacterium]|nr:helix-hairpin-helix domain-containing protein [Candidatus Berkelbacteria bacterium]